MSTNKPVSADIARSFSSILRLEGERDYTNTVVHGGLDRFIERHSDTLYTLLKDHALAHDLLKIEYSIMQRDERRKWALAWLNGIQEDGMQPKSTSSSNLHKIVDPCVTTNLSTRTIKKPPFDVNTGKNAKVQSSINLDSPVDYLPYVGKKLAIKLNRLGVNNVSDILYLFPRRHSDFSDITTVSKLVPGNEQTVVVTVWEAKSERRGRSRRRDTEVILGDETGNVKAVWFGQPHIVRSLPTNTRVVISGKVRIYKGTPVFESPEYEVIDYHETKGVHTGRLIPVYPLTEGLSPRTLRRIIWTALDRCIDQVTELLPPVVLKETGFMPLADAIVQAHYPDNLQIKELARRRLAFDEFFLIQLAVLKQRNNNQQSTTGISLASQPKLLNRFFEALPFDLTKAQDKTLEEILDDINTGTPPMSRLLQGEVGSGKTVVALGALLTAATNGYQSAIMAPTEILAEQHFLTVGKLLQGKPQAIEKEGFLSTHVDPHPHPIEIGLLTGSMRPRIKEKIRSRLATGSLDIVIGTQALVQEGVKIPNLALAVVDEQHRFGVIQRASLRDRGNDITPHVLVMSATPIPRTLALTIFGDLDISTIDELPPGRQEITTRWVPPNKRDKAYLFVQNQVTQGRQAFVICPLIEESDSLQAKAATEEYHRLSEKIFPDLQLGLLHGKMPPSEKDQVMDKFRSHQLDILVSTPVVEVGIDVPNATVMLVEAADRFGLSQLHQFRGRVGRGEHKSYCLLLAEDPSEVAQERLLAMERIHNGFKLAEMDLSLRGPGEYFGTKQSGFPGLKMASLSDSDLLVMARQQASSLLNKDPQMTHEDNEILSHAISSMAGKVSDEVS